MARNKRKNPCTCRCLCHQAYTAEQEELAFWRQWLKDYLAQIRFGPVEQEMLRYAARFFRQAADGFPQEDPS